MTEFLLNDDNSLTPIAKGERTVMKSAGLTWEGSRTAGDLAHPGTLDNAEFGDTIPAINLAKELLGQIKQNTENAIAARMTPDPRDSDAAHRERVKAAVASVSRSNANHQALAIAAVDLEIIRLNALMTTQVGIKKGDYDVEIRNSIKSMKPGERAAALAAALADNDVETLSAILLAPTITHGVDEDRKRALNTQLLSKMMPREYAMREYLYSSKAKLTKLTPVLDTLHSRLLAGTDKYDKENAKAAELRQRIGM